jgi:hypothetical protein
MKVIFFNLNQKFTYVSVATDKLTSQRVTSQLLGGSNLLNTLVCSGFLMLDYNNYHNLFLINNTDEIT